MDYDAIACSPESPASAATGFGYSRMAFAAGLLATYIRGIGYKAIPCGNDTACSIPLAIDAGLGELGRNCMLITPEYGPRVRIAKVFTNLPLVTDKPIEFGVWEFCKICKKCAEHCPSQALSLENPTETPIDKSNREGLLTWHIDAKKCAAFWASNGACCSNCIRTCPYNKKSGVLHDTARWVIRHSRMFDRTLVRLDDFFGYGKKKNSAHFWKV
jgi:reductive dehalogenase